MEKSISIKVYDQSGTFLKEWPNAAFSGFSKEINGGLSECIIELGVPFDYQGVELAEGNVVDITISDKQVPAGKRIYSGYISLIEPHVEGNMEGVTVNLLGHYTKLSTDFLKNNVTTKLYSDSSAGLTTTASGSAADIGLIIRGIIDRYRAETVSPKLYYSTVSIPLAGQTALYAISLKTYREAFDKIISMYGSNYFYYIDEDGLVTVKQKPTAPTHTFQFGKHFSSVKIHKSLEKVRNFLLIWNGETGAGSVYNHYQDDASIKQYGRRSEYIEDFGIADNTSADKIGAKFIAENKDPDVKLVCELIDDNVDSINGYDVDSVQPGDSCRFVGFNQSLSSIINDNMLITKVDYTLGKITLTIEMNKSGIVNWQNKTAKEVNDLMSQGIPATYS